MKKDAKNTNIEIKKIPLIPRGMVIDHMPTGVVNHVEAILELSTFDQVMIGKNFDSKKTGPRSKDIIKVEGFHRQRLTKEIQDKIAVVCRKAPYPTTIWFIENYEPDEKIVLALPSVAVNVIKCFNPNCVTVLEGHTVLRKTFYVLEKDPLVVRCHYCERIMREKEIKLL